MNGGEVTKGVEAVPAPRLHESGLAAITGDLAGEFDRPQFREIWLPTEPEPARPEVPPVLHFNRNTELLVYGDLLLLALWGLLIPAADPSFPRWIYMGLMLPVYSSWIFILRLYDARPQEKSSASMKRTLLASLFATVSFYLLLLLAGFRFSMGMMAIQALLVFSALSCWRTVYERIARSDIAKIPVLIAGAGHRGMAVYGLLAHAQSPWRVESFLDDSRQAGTRPGLPPVAGTCIDVDGVAAATGARQVIIAMSHDCRPESLRTLTRAKINGLVVREATDVYEEITGRIPVRYIDDHWFISARGFSLLYSRSLLFFKRVMDISVSLLLGLLALPALAIIGLLIKLDSRGPLLYRQERVGKNGKIFTMLKFRSMREDAETNGACWAQECDPRITRIGRFLRKFRVDEFPQILNILKGDMSFVGPRPERPEFVAVLEKEVPHYSIRHTVKPGITGWAQVILKYGASVGDALDKLEADLYYIKNMSLLLDLKILMRTVGVVLLSQGSR